VHGPDDEDVEKQTETTSTGYSYKYEYVFYKFEDKLNLIEFSVNCGTARIVG
jgi:hypothetical protein